MKQLLLHAGLIAAGLITAATAAAQNQTTVAITVVNSVTGAPVPSAIVVIGSELGVRASGRTDAGGVFKASLDTGGSFLLTESRKGYWMTGGAMGKAIEVKSGTENSIKVEMLPLGILAGRVVDQFGDPVRNVIVRTEDRMQSAGAGEYYQSLASTITDDLGEYRMAGVGPGKHYVAFEYNSSNMQRTTGIRVRPALVQTGALVLYPNAISLEEAQEIDFEAGVTKRLNDVRLNIQPAVTIRGMVKAPGLGAGAAAASGAKRYVSLERSSKLELTTYAAAQGGGVDSEGRFKFEVALPGQYLLKASDAGSGKTSKPLTVEVRDRDVAGLELELNISYELRGRIVLDGGGSLDFSKIMLNFGAAPVTIDAGGRFQTNLAGDKGTFVVQGLPAGWYVKEVLIGGKAVSGRVFAVESGTTDVAITLSSRGARLTVRVEGKPAVGHTAVVVLIPETGPMPDVESLPIAEARDASGVFVMPGVAPGAYRVYALDATNWLLVMRPEVLLEKHREAGTLIQVADGEEKTVVVRPAKVTFE